MTEFKSLFKYRSFNFVFALFVFLIVWRVGLAVLPSFNTDANIQIWAASYQIVAWCGAIIGFVFAEKWGGYKSLLGRAALGFSLGLLMQSFGQSVFSWYFYTGNALPYPSLADLGFFGSIPFYIYGMSCLSKVAGATFSLRSSVNKFWAIFIPAALLVASYAVFLRGYQFDPTQPLLKAFLDFGYPLGQAVYISIAILAYIFSKNILGGVMRNVILSFIFALAVQYIADYTFLYQSLHGTFVGGGIDDCLYLLAYTLMAVSLVRLGVIFHQINTSKA